MLKDIYAIVSLQIFRVSLTRKLWLVFKLVVFGFLIWFWFLHEHLSESSLSQELMLLMLVGLGANIGVSLIRFWIVSTYRIRTKQPIGERDNFMMGVDSLSNLLVLLIIIGGIFPVFAIPFTSFLTSISLFSVAIAWLFKEYLTNFFDSFRLMFSKDFLIGDYIKISDTSKGVITDITFRATKVKTDEGDVLFIPNTTLMNTEVTNYSKVKYKRITVPFNISINSLRDFERFESHLAKQLLEEFTDLIDPEKIFLRIKNIDNGHVDCALEVAIDSYSFGIEDRIHKKVYKTILGNDLV